MKPSLGMKPSLCGLYKLCRAFYRCQFGCEAFALRSVQALQLRVSTTHNSHHKIGSALTMLGQNPGNVGLLGQAIHDLPACCGTAANTAHWESTLVWSVRVLCIQILRVQDRAST